MKILKINIITLFLGISLFSYGQQQKYFSNHHYYNPYAVNSASSGLLKSPELFLTSSVTNMNMEGRPSTFYASGIWTFNQKNFALGLSYLNDKVGVFSDNLLKISYAYRLNFKEEQEGSYNNLYEHSLSFGVDGGLRFINDNLLSLEMTSDPLLARNMSKIIPVFGASVMYNHPDFFVGLSMDNLVILNKKEEVNQTKIEQEKPLYLYGGYRWTMNERLLLTPNILIRHNFETPIIVDYSLKLDFNDMFLASVGYRDSGAVNFGFGVKLFDKKLDLIGVANLYTKSNFFGNLFGIMLKYNIAKKVN